MRKKCNWDCDCLELTLGSLGTILWLGLFVCFVGLFVVLILEFLASIF